MIVLRNMSASFVVKPPSTEGLRWGRDAGAFEIRCRHTAGGDDLIYSRKANWITGKARLCPEIGYGCRRSLAIVGPSSSLPSGFYFYWQKKEIAKKSLCK
jgi:hypothetical protein